MRVAAWTMAGLVLAGPARAGSREVQLGFEEFHYRTAETALNRGNVLGLEEDEDLLRATLGYKESRGALRLVFRGFVEKRLRHDADADWTTREAYAQYGFGDGFSVRIGKQRVSWGSGFAWNPTSRLEPPKNPLNPSLEQQGALAVRTDWIPSAWAGVILVAAENESAAPDLPLQALPSTKRTAAVRARFLVRDTDVAAVFSGGHGQRTLVGLDVGRTFGPVSAHAEASTYRGAELPPARDDERFARLVAGLLWTRDQTSLSAEYFYNGEGYSQDALDLYLVGLDAAYDRSVDPSLPPEVQAAERRRYLALASVPFSGGLGLRRHYLQAAWSRGTSSGTWTAGLRGVVSLQDGGTALTPGLTWSPTGRLTANLDAILLLGPDDSEYRLSPLRGALQTRVKVIW
ncbi:MAG TPA: hypothetical protein VFQ51_12965 [Vicinamibacteria bacterium]|nr:hypothetical protein [Vicinamibacteria bacterium]